MAVVAFAQAGDHQLLGFLASLDVKRRVFLGEPRQAAGDLLLVASSLGRDGQAVGGSGNVDRGHGTPVLHPQRVARERVGELGRRGDVARVDHGRGDVLLAAGEEDLGKPLLASAAEVGQMGVRLHGARNHLEIADAPELVTAGVEDEGPGRLVRLPIGRGHQLRDRRHQRAHTEQLGRRTAHDRRHLAFEDSLAQAALDLFLAQRPGVEVLLEQRVVALGGRLNELTAVLVDPLLHVIGDRDLASLAVLRGHERLEVQEVDDAAEVLLGADREVQRERPRREALAHGAHGAVEVGVLLVELVHDHDARFARAVALLPGDLRPDRELRGGPDHDHGAFGRPQAAGHLAGEVQEPRRVEDVDLVAVVLGERDAEVDRDLPSLFLGLEVGGGGGLVWRTHARHGAGGEEHRLREHRLAVVRMAQ